MIMLTKTNLWPFKKIPGSSLVFCFVVAQSTFLGAHVFLHFQKNHFITNTVTCFWLLRYSRHTRTPVAMVISECLRQNLLQNMLCWSTSIQRTQYMELLPTARKTKTRSSRTPDHHRGASKERYNWFHILTFSGTWRPKHLTLGVRVKRGVFFMFSSSVLTSAVE